MRSIGRCGPCGASFSKGREVPVRPRVEQDRTLPGCERGPYPFRRHPLPLIMFQKFRKLLSRGYGYCGRCDSTVLIPQFARMDVQNRILKVRRPAKQSQAIPAGLSRRRYGIFRKTCTSAESIASIKAQAHHPASEPLAKRHIMPRHRAPPNAKLRIS